jgi:molybdate transport system permease protein
MQSELEQAFEKQVQSELGEPVELQLVFGGSRALAQQLATGAPLDAIVTAGLEPILELNAQGKLVPGIYPLFRNQLRLIVSQKFADANPELLIITPNVLKLLNKSDRFAVGNRRSAPVGKYTMQVLERMIYPRIPLDGDLQQRAVMAENVAQIVTWLQSGDVDAGFVYQSDVVTHGLIAVELGDQFERYHDPILYIGAASEETSNPDLAIQFLSIFQQAKIKKMLMQRGFSVDSPDKITSSNDTTEIVLTDSVATSTISSGTLTKQSDMSLHPFRLSLQVGLLATLLNLVIGLPLAWLVARYHFVGKAAINTLLLLPLVLPPTVIGLVLVYGFGQSSASGRFLNDMLNIQLLFTWQGAIIASSLVSLPLFVKPVQAAFESIPEIYFEEGRLLGMTPVREFWFLGLPLAIPGILAGLSLSMARAIGEFGATLMVAGNIPGVTQTLPIAIYSATLFGDWAAAWRYGASLAVTAVLLVLVSHLFVKRFARLY